MSIKNFLKKQLASVIEWETPSSEVIWQRWAGSTDEIKNASKLLIKPGQGAALVYEGALNDIIVDDGLYNLRTDNHPFITSLIKLSQLFESEHKLQIYFFQTSQIINENWGTSQSIKYQEPQYEFPVEMGCHGTYSYKISAPELLYTEIIGSQDLYTKDDVRKLFGGRLPVFITTHLADKKYGYNSIDAQKLAIGDSLLPVLRQEMNKMGLHIFDFKLLGTQFTEETQKHINKIAQMQSDNYAAQDVNMSYEELEKLRALKDAANNEGGAAGAGVGLGAGIQLGQAFVNAETAKDFLKPMENSEASKKTTGSQKEAIQLISELKSLLDQGAITQDEFDAKKSELLGKI